MKKFYSLILFLGLSISLSFAQERYLDEIFTDVTVTPDVTYGVNGTILFFGQVGEIVPEALMMDIYEPEGDTEVDRPVVLVFHTGNFLPPVTNGQIPGTRQDNSVVEFCTQLARRGYVTAAVSYRLGWNPLAPTQPERALGLIQAAYRGVQDGRNAIRFIKTNADTYGIDENNVTVLGLGTGGYLTLGLVGLSDYNEILTTTNGPTKFFLDVDMDGTVETPMVVEAFHGDINGEVLTIAPTGVFGFPAGDTTNYANFVGVDNSFQLGINVGGALGDISWLADNSTPTISIQSPFDQFAPYNDAVLVVPTTGDPIVQVQGAQQIGAAQEAAGNNQMWLDANFNDAITQTAMDNSATAGHPYYEGVFPFIRPANSLGIDEGVVVDWWDENAPSPANGAGMGIPWNMLPHPAGGTFHTNGLLINEGMGPEKARANIADVMAYILPRACVALELPCAANFTTSTREVLLDTGMEITPNPASQEVRVTVGGEYQIIDMEVYDMTGKLVQNYQGVNASEYVINRNNLTSGMYLVKATFEEGVQTVKVLFE